MDIVSGGLFDTLCSSCLEDVNMYVIYLHSSHDEKILICLLVAIPVSMQRNVVTSSSQNLLMKLNAISIQLILIRDDPMYMKRTECPILSFYYCSITPLRRATWLAWRMKGQHRCQPILSFCRVIVTHIAIA